MAFFVSKLMRNSFGIILILLTIVGSICGSTQSYSQYEDYNYGEDSNYESEELKSGEPETSHTIGQLEFDVEVAEQMPDSRQMAPEVLVVDEKRRNKNQKNRKDLNVITEVPVDMGSGSSQIGNIELNIELKPETKRPKTGSKNSAKRVKNFQNPPENDSENESNPEEQESSKTSEGSEMDTTLSPDQSIPETSSTDGSKDKSNEEPEQPTATPVLPTEEEDTAETPKKYQRPTDLPKKMTVWPIILISIVFIILVVIGIIWGLWQLFVYHKSLNKEKISGAAKISDTPKSDTPMADTPKADTPMTDTQTNP